MKRFDERFIMDGRMWETRILSLDPSHNERLDGVRYGSLVHVLIAPVGKDGVTSDEWYVCSLSDDSPAIGEMLDFLGLSGNRASNDASHRFFRNLLRMVDEAERGGEGADRLMPAPMKSTCPVVFMRSNGVKLFGYVALPSCHPCHGFDMDEMSTLVCMDVSYCDYASVDEFHLDASAVPLVGNVLDVDDDWWIVGIGDIGCYGIGNDRMVQRTRRLHDSLTEAVRKGEHRRIIEERERRAHEDDDYYDNLFD